MVEMDVNIDLDLGGKKKKKKKGAIDMGVDALKELAASDASQQLDKPVVPVKLDQPVSSMDGMVPEEPANNKQDDDDKEIEELLQLKPKKKKKKKPPDMASVTQEIEELAMGAVDSLAEAGAVLEIVPEGARYDRRDITIDDFELPSKKKRRRPNITFEGFDLAVVEDVADEAENAAEVVIAEDDESGKMPWEGSDRDYTYEELLERVFTIIKHNNPNFASGQRKKLVMKPPQVVRVGAKKTSFVNFTEICRLLHRQPKHLMNFLLVELGTSASLDATQQLIIKGKFQQKQIETVLRRYIKEYVTCHTCRSPETNLHKETRLFFLQCETCGSRCSVQNIKFGFQAVTGKRAQMRSKAQK